MSLFLVLNLGANTKNPKFSFYNFFRHFEVNSFIEVEICAWKFIIEIMVQFLNGFRVDVNDNLRQNFIIVSRNVDFWN